VHGSARQLLGAMKQTKNHARLLLARPQCRLAFTNPARCQAKFLTSHHVPMHRIILYIPNTLIKLIIRAWGKPCLGKCVGLGWEKEK